MSDLNSAHVPEGIAVIGMAGRFPGASSVAEFWQNLRDGVESIKCFTDEELLASGVSPAMIRNPNYVKARGVVDGIEYFDAPFFHISAREATIMDPQHRVFLECAWEALEDAGYDPHSYPGSIGVYAGAGSALFLLSNLKENADCWRTDGAHQILIGNERDHLATRVAYKLNLRGPSLTVQTSCSTSLVAVHMACQSLMNFECDMMLAGGVSLKPGQQQGYLYQEEGIHSPDGHCRAFDADAKGTVGGSGAGIVILKRLAEALEDGDNILAVIKGSAINNDGAGKVGYTAPSVQGQAEAIVAAAGIAGVSFDSVSYIETHGTGTVLGDPIEVKALTQAFRTQTKKNEFCAIGSVKTNIGHLNTASGVAGLIKTIKAMQHRQIPPSLHYRRPNPQIDFANSPFYVNSTLAPWKQLGGTRIAGISSFGIGGTNAHVIIEEPPALDKSSPGSPWLVFPISARSPKALKMAGDDLAGHLRAHPDLPAADVAYTLQVGRHAFSERRLLLSQSLEGVVEEWSSPKLDTDHTASCVPETSSVVFLMPGQGARLLHEGREIYQHVPAFRESMDHCAKLLTAQLGIDIRELLYPTPDCVNWATEQLTHTALVQPVLFALEYSLAMAWRAWGVAPQALLGHSLGEYVAACISGVFTLEAALWLVAERGRLQEQTAPGAMVAVSLSEVDIRPWLKEGLWLAAVNGRQQCTVSGLPEAVEQLETSLQAEDIGFTRLSTSHAFHSGLMDPIVEPFLACVRRVALSPPTVPFISNVTGTWIQPHEATDPEYWGRHMREAVRFGDGLEQTFTDLGHLILLEVGPGTILSKLSRGLAREHEGAVISTLPGVPPIVTCPETEVQLPVESDAEFKRLMEAVGRIWLAGGPVDWTKFAAGQRRRRISLPTYRFQRKRHWIDPTRRIAAHSHVPEQSHRAERREDMSDWFYLPAWIRAELLPANRSIVENDDSRCCLIFADRGMTSTNLIDRMVQGGSRVVVVSPGPEFCWTAEARVSINIESPDDYTRLIAEVSARYGDPRRIVHLWSVASSAQNDDPRARFADAQKTGYYSVLYVAQAAARSSIAGLSLTVVGSEQCDVTGEESLYPDKSTHLALLTVIRQELPDIQCHCIDIPITAVDEQANWMTDQLVAEVFQNNPEPFTAYRNRDRYLLEYLPGPLNGMDTPIRRLRPEGVYLITGGLGSIGFSLAQHLGRSLRARLVLVGRADFPERDHWDQWLERHEESDQTSAKIRTIVELEKAGSVVTIVAADVANTPEMSRVIADVYDRHGVLNGVFHVAGVTREQGAMAPIPEIETETAERHFRAKAHGLYTLEEVLQGCEVDFCVLFGSNASVLGGFGYGAYAPANGFMNAFASDRSKNSAFPWICINWDGWSMRQARGQGPQGIHRLSVTTEEGFAALDRIISHHSSGPIIVSATDLSVRMRTWLYGDSINTRKSEKQDDLLQSEDESDQIAARIDYVAPRTAVEQRLTELWQRLLGIDRVGVSDNFFDLGGHSLLAVRLFARIEAELGKRLPLATLFHSPTIAAIAPLLETESHKPQQWSSLVGIQPTGTRPPFFCVHAIGANILNYRLLSKYLGTDQPFYGFQSQGLDGVQAPHTSVEQMAAHYITEMKSVQPNGPYLLGGGSGGGIIAFEMARQLEQAGDEIGLLVLIDTLRRPRRRQTSFLARVKRLVLVADAHVGELLVRSRSERYTYAADWVREKLRQVRVRFRRSTGDRRLNIIGVGLDAAIKANRAAVNSYVPKPYSGRITQLLARQRSMRTAEDPRLVAWSELTNAGLEVRFIDGNHDTMLEEPHVQVLADTLSACLKNATNSSSTSPQREKQ